MTDYGQLVHLLARYSQNANRLTEMQRMLDGILLAAVGQMQVEHAQLQEEQAIIESSMERIARAHPEWFEKLKSVTTPVGVVKMTATPSLDVADEQLSIALLDRHFPDTADFYKRVETTLNKEALEALDDDELKKLKIVRKRGESFKATPAKVNLGKAIKTAEGRK